MATTYSVIEVWLINLFRFFSHNKILCKNCECWIDPENNPTGEYLEYGFCTLLSGSLDWGEAEEKHGKSKAIATCDSEGIYGELQTRADFGCILFRMAQQVIPKFLYISTNRRIFLVPYFQIIVSPYNLS